jgi:hypothetical protein
MAQPEKISEIQVDQENQKAASYTAEDARRNFERFVTGSVDSSLTRENEDGSQTTVKAYTLGVDFADPGGEALFKRAMMDAHLAGYKMIGGPIVDPRQWRDHETQEPGSVLHLFMEDPSPSTPSPEAEGIICPACGRAV